VVIEYQPECEPDEQGRSKRLGQVWLPQPTRERTCREGKQAELTTGFDTRYASSLCSINSVRQTRSDL